MITERWRVGSLTMGLVLILFGAVTLASLIAGFSAVNILLTLWPVILICLGVEILLHLFFRKKGTDEIKLKYDVLSILFIGFILLLSSLFYAFTYVSELYGSREALSEALGIRNEKIYEEYSREFPGADKLIVFNAFYGNITVIPASGDTIKVNYDISLRTSDRNYAESVIGRIISFEGGENAYMFSNTNRVTNDMTLGWPTVNCVIHLPEGKTLDLSQFGGYVEFDRSIEEQIVFQDDRWR